MMQDNIGERWVIVKRFGECVIVKALQSGAVLLLIRSADGVWKFLLELVK